MRTALKYNEEIKNNKTIKFFDLLKSEKNNIIKILLANWIMLLFGYLG
jgi:hypothetical protein